MGFDRTDDAEAIASAADRPVRAVPGPERGGEIRERDGLVAAVGAGRERGAGDGMTRGAAEAPGGKLAAEDRIAAHVRARETAAAVYADWGRKTDRVVGAAGDPAHLSRADGDQRNRAAETASRGHPDEGPAAGRDSPARSPDTSPGSEEALRRRVSELEADKAVSDRRLTGYEARLTEQDKTIAGEGKHMARLEAELGRVAGALDELRGKQEEPQASAQIEGRYRGEQAEQPEWRKAQHKRGLPTDAVNNAVSVAVGSAIMALPYQLHNLPPEAAGLAAGGVAFGAGIIAVWRERRKEKDDDGHRPEN